MQLQFHYSPSLSLSLCSAEIGDVFEIRVHNDHDNNNNNNYYHTLQATGLLEICCDGKNNPFEDSNSRAKRMGLGDFRSTLREAGVALNKHTLKRLFNLMDRNNTGAVSAADFRSVLTAMAAGKPARQRTPAVADTPTMISSNNNNNRVSPRPKSAEEEPRSISLQQQPATTPLLRLDPFQCHVFT